MSMQTKYRIFGKNHEVTVVGCVLVSDDPDHPADYWLWTLRLLTPVMLYDGSILYQTFVRRFHAAENGLAVPA